MEILRKKTSDAALEKLIVAAAKQGIDLSWDRYESKVPLCGFGRISLCCNICAQGPCHINPFDEKDKPGVCGRSREVIVASNFLRLIADGAASIINYAGDTNVLPGVVKERVVDEEMLPTSTVNELICAQNMYTEGLGTAEDFFYAAARLALAAYSSLASCSVKTGVEEVEAGVGALKKDKANLLVFGAMAPEKVAEVTAAATGVNVVAMAGSETPNTSIVGNFASQEALLMSGLIDAVVVGSACVTAGFVSIANELDIPVFCAEQDSVDEAVAAARENFKKRQNADVAFECAPVRATVGYSKACFSGIKEAKLETIINKYPIKGIVIMGGCNNVKTTQDQSIVEQAKRLIQNDVLVLATGCAAAALAKAGLMDPGKVNEYAGSNLVNFLGALGAASGVGRLPAVLHCGTCWQLPVAVELATFFGLPISASFPEVTMPAAWNSIIALAAMGIPTYVGPVLPVEGTPAAVAALQNVFDNKLITMKEALTPEITAQQVAAALME